jgi:hypothetical protein
MNKIYYEKVGRKYVPVAEYDSMFMDSFAKGNHLVMCYPGGTSRRFNIEPALAPMIAAGRFAEDEMCRIMVLKATEMRPQSTPVTPAQKDAWQKLSEAFGDTSTVLQGAAIRDIVDEGLKALQVEAEKLLRNEAVKQAYEQFLFIAALTKEHNDNASTSS